jgi:hypothetical protein
MFGICGDAALPDVAAERTARHRQRLELPTLFTSVPNVFWMRARIWQSFRGISMHATVPKTVA